MRAASKMAMLMTLCALAGVACGKKEESAGSTRDGGSPAPAASGDRAAAIAGAWMRETGTDPRREGFYCGPDGLFRLIGGAGSSGVAWSVDGDSLRITTNSQRYPDPEENRFRIAELSASRLTLQGMGRLAGTYERDDGACGLVTGTVSYAQRMALPPDAVVEVALRDVSRQDVLAPLLAVETIRMAGRQVPIPFTLAYDTDAIDSRFTYAVAARISSEGRLCFINRTAHPVITRESPSQVEILVEPVGP